MEQIISPQFAGIARQFAEVGAERPGWNGGLAVHIHGEPVLDVWAGPVYDGTQIQSVYSVTKGVAAGCVALLAQRGLIDYDAPMSRYWPEFAAGGKERVAVRTVLSHQAGLPTVDGGFLDDGIHRPRTTCSPPGRPDTALGAREAAWLSRANDGDARPRARYPSFGSFY